MDPNQALKNWLDGCAEVYSATLALHGWLARRGAAPHVKVRAALEGEGAEYEGPWGTGVISEVTTHSLTFVPDKGIPRKLVFTGMREFILQDTLTSKLVRVEIDE